MVINKLINLKKTSMVSKINLIVDTINFPFLSVFIQSKITFKFNQI